MFDFLEGEVTWKSKIKYWEHFWTLSKAFDSIDHQVLLARLGVYGVRGPPLNWIRSYLQDRRQRVCIRKDGVEAVSDDRELNRGIS